MSAALVALVALTGCETTTEIEYIRPDCRVPPLPAVVAPEWSSLLLPFDYMPQSHTDTMEYSRALDQLEAYDMAVADSLIEHRAMLRAICEMGAPSS